MPRQARLDAPETLHHMMIRGIERKSIFLDNRDRKDFGKFGQRERKAIRGYRRFMEEGKGQGRRAELVGGGLVRSLGGWSQVLSLRGQGERVAYDSRVLGGEIL